MRTGTVYETQYNNITFRALFPFRVLNYIYYEIQL